MRHLEDAIGQQRIAAVVVGCFTASVELRSTGTFGTQTLALAAFNNDGGSNGATSYCINYASDTELAGAFFSVVPTGGIQFKVDSDAVGPNCGATASPTFGGGMTDTVLELKTMDNNWVCHPATFTIGGAVDGGTPQTFVNDCTGNSQLGRCLENNEVVKVEGIPSGPQRLHLAGLRGLNECYATTAEDIIVPGANLVYDLLTMGMSFESSGQGCQ